MARIDLPNSLRSAMSVPGAEPPPAAQTPVAAPEALPPPPYRPTSLRGRLFGRLADYARRYLTASVEHRLTLTQSEIGLMRAQLDRVEDLNRRLERYIADLNANAVEHRQILAAQIWQSRDDLTGRVDAIGGILGPRFDELEIKVRPLIAYDEASYAVRLRDGYAMVPKSQPAFALSIANATSGGLEPGTRTVLQALIRPGMAVADVGANIGLLTLAAAVAVGPEGRVYAFEPEPGPREQLEKTLYVNGLRQVEVFDCAVGARRARLTFHVSPIIGHSSLYALPPEEGAATAVKVQVRPLDEVIEGPLDVVKIDVEGAELDVLAGMPRLLADNPDLALIVEYGPSHLARVGVAQDAWFAAFADAGFVAYAIDEATGTCRPTSQAALADAVSVNLAFVQPGGAAEKRLPR